MNDIERQIKLRALQRKMQILWDRMEACQKSEAVKYAMTQERFEAMELEERSLLRTGRMIR